MSTSKATRARRRAAEPKVLKSTLPSWGPGTSKEAKEAVPGYSWYSGPDERDPVPDFAVGDLLGGCNIMDASDASASADGPRHTLMHTSIKSKDFLAVQQLIGLSADCVNARCKCGVDHFLSAVESGEVRIVNLMISSKADVNAFGLTELANHPASPLHIACARKSYDMVKSLIQAGADVNARCIIGPIDKGNAGNTPMHLNASYYISPERSVSDGKYLISETERIQTLLISTGADIDAQNAKGQTPLQLSINTDFTSMQCFLIRNGADFNIIDSEQQNALVCAVVQGRTTATALLLANRCGIPATDIPLVCEAARRNGWSMIMQLLNNGANINDTDERGCNAIHYALMSDEGPDNCCRETHIVARLINNGCNPCHVNKAGLTPLEIAMERGPTYKLSHAEYILLEHAVGFLYRLVYGPPPATAKDMAALMDTSWHPRDVELLFKITSGLPAYRTAPECHLLYDLHKMRKALVADKNAREMLAGEPPASNAKQRRSKRKADELKLRTDKATYIQALLRRSVTPPYAHNNTRECVVCFGLCSVASMPVLAPCGHRNVCAVCLPSIGKTCPSCREPVLCVARKVFD